jgi:hypothetical protein
VWQDRGVKRGQRILLTVAACGALAVVATLVWPGEREPEYQGKKLSWWIRGSQMRGGIFPHAERGEAVRQIGTNGLPFLVRWIECGNAPRRTKIDAAITKANGSLGAAWAKFRSRKLTRANDAVWAFSVLGNDARPAIPELIKLAHNTNRSVALSALLALDGVAQGDTKGMLGWLNAPKSTVANGDTNGIPDAGERGERVTH